MPAPFGAVILDPMSDVTPILSAIEQGDPHAAEQLLPLVYDELRKLAAERMAQEKPGQTLQATADDSEFTTPGDQGEQGRMDLLTALKIGRAHV